MALKIYKTNKKKKKRQVNLCSETIFQFLTIESYGELLSPPINNILILITIIIIIIRKLVIDIYICGKRNIVDKGKLLVISIFSFSHNIVKRPGISPMVHLTYDCEVKTTI